MSVTLRERSPIALGAASLTFDMGVPREQAIATVHAAIDAGVRLIDTARAYTRAGHPAHNEELVAEALAGHENGGQVLVATKGGHWRAPDGTFPIDGGRDRLRADAELSLRVLGVPALELYYLHWPDPQLPIESSVEALEELRADGLIERIGLSNIDPDQLRRARQIAPIDAVQNHFSPFDTGDEPMVDACAEAGISYLPYSPLGGSGRSGTLAGAVPAAAGIADRRGVSVQRLLLAWLIRRGSTLVPIVGARRPETVVDSARAGELAADLDDAEVEALSGALSSSSRRPATQSARRRS